MITKTTLTDSDSVVEDRANSGLRLVIMSVDSFAAFSLPRTGSLVIGRSTGCEIQLEDPLASRRHAALHLTETGAEIEDLGSANGTRLRDTLIDRGDKLPLAKGETIQVGSTVLVLQSDSGSPYVRRVWSHRWFESKLREHCARSDVAKDRFALGRLRLSRSVPWSKVLPALDSALAAPHLFAAYGPHDYEFLFLNVDRDGATALTDRLRAQLQDLDPETRFSAACYPRDGRTPDALMARANMLLRPQAETEEPAPEPSALGPAMQAVQDLATKAARANINVLILGETGVGKEVMAQAIHRMSPRAKAPMLAINCAGLSETLIESELFGHEKGAFTGATQNKRGLFEAAQGGTLFLDEIGEMPLTVQAKVLRAIANREIMPVGALRPRAIDVRVISATNRDLEQEIGRNTFRQDLYYRLNGITLQIPPLRERRSEIAALTREFLALAAKDMQRPVPSLSDAAALLLQEYDWPGNIRELRNIIERAVVLCEGDMVDVGHLPAERLRAPMANAIHAARTSPGMRRALTVGEQEDKRRIMQALENNTWNQSRAAKALGIARRTFVAKLDRYGIARPQKPGVATPTDDPDEPEVT